METKENQHLVSERMELESKGIGAVGVTRKPVGIEIALKFLDAVLALSAIIVPGKDFFSPTRAVGNNEADVGAQGAHFDLNHDPAFFLPAPGPMPKAIENSERLFGAGILALGSLKPAFGSLFKDRVGGNPDGIKRLEGFQSDVDLWSGRAGVRPIAELALRKTPLNDGDQAAKLNGDAL